MMNINWKVRVKNPVFWAELAVAIVLPILTYMGINWSDMTTWGVLWNVLLEAVKNPVIIVSVIVSVWNLIIDPTTAGIRDSSQALTYEKPKAE
jgi:phi LC3 family holin